jgi:hypothetical protein
MSGNCFRTELCQIHSVHIPRHEDVRHDQIEAALEALDDNPKPLKRSLLLKSLGRVV